MSNSSLQAERRAARKQEDRSYHGRSSESGSQATIEGPEPTDRPPSGYSRQNSSTHTRHSSVPSGNHDTPSSKRRTGAESDTIGRRSRPNSTSETKGNLGQVYILGEYILDLRSFGFRRTL